MATSRYVPVATSDADDIGMQEVLLNNNSTAAADPSVPPSHHYSENVSRPPTTKRGAYSTHRIEHRTPRLAGETDEQYQRRLSRAHWSAMLHSVCWVTAAILIVYFTDLWNVIRYDYRVNHSFLVLGFLSMGVVAMVVAYLAIWVPLTATKPVLDLTAYAPRAGPIGAGAGVATFVFFAIALWPIWQWITLPILIVLSFAACLGPNLIPF